ncbi:MAG: hypothetical protein K5985_11620 [Lachnospiraceae bacterium]|nr:hypothetical protein [Lachnospiraceae bacterium]
MKRVFSAILSFLIILALLAGSVSVYAAEPSEEAPGEAAEAYEPDYGAVYDGGGLVAQNGDYSFYNDPDNRCFIARNRSTGKEKKLTDFPAANININGNSMVFTDMAATISTAMESSSLNTDRKYLYGGGLYRIEDLSNIENNSAVSRIGEKGKDYYRVSYDEDGLYCLCADEKSDELSYQKLNPDGSQAGYLGAGDGETILDAAELEGYLYLEILGSDGISYILCVDRDHGTGRKTVFPGMNMHLISGRIVYWCTEDLYLYAIRPGEEESYVISYLPASYMHTVADYIICRDEYDHYEGINFCISLTSAVSLYEKTYYFPVNGWVNMIEVFEAASPSSGRSSSKSTSASTPGHSSSRKTESSSGGGRSSSEKGSSEKPPEKTGPDPNDAVREARDLCDYYQHSDLGRLEYNNTPALQERFLELYFDGETRSISELIREAARESAAEINRRVGGGMSSDQLAEAENIIFSIIYDYLTSIQFDCRLKREVREGLAVVTISTDRYLNIADVYSNVTQVNQIYSVGYRQVDYTYGNYQVDVKVSYREKEEHWRIDLNDLERLIKLIFGVGEPPQSGGSGSTSSTATTKSTSKSGSDSQTSSGSKSSSGSQATSSSSGSSSVKKTETGSGGEGKACTPVRDIPDLVYIREKNMVDPSEGFPGDEDTESAIRAYKELLEGYPYPAIGEAFKRTSDAMNMWFLGDETRRELGEQVKVIRDDLLDDYYEQRKKDPNNKFSDKELEEEKRKDREAFDYLNRLIRDYNPQTFGEKAMALYDGLSDAAGGYWRAFKGMFTGKNHQEEYLKEQYEARNRAYNWMMGNIYGEMYSRAKDRIDNSKYSRLRDVSYCNVK